MSEVIATTRRPADSTNFTHVSKRFFISLGGTEFPVTSQAITYYKRCFTPLVITTGKCVPICSLFPNVTNPENSRHFC